jgi:GxxExxY protein
LERAHRPGPSRFEVKCAYRADAIVEDRLLLELKAIERILPIHHQQTLTYLKLSQLRQGLLINFNSKRLVDGVKRFLL